MSGDLHKCVLCHRQDTARMACVDCTTALDAMLGDLPEFYALTLGEYLASATGQKGSAISIGLNVGVLDGRTPRAAIWALESWERDWRETLPTFGHSETADADQRGRKAQRWADAESADFIGVNLCGVVDFLRVHLEVAATTHPAIDEFASELRAIHAEARAAAGESESDVTKVRCPADVERGGEVVACGALLHLAGEHCVCHSCGTDWDRPRLLLVARAAGSDVYAPLNVLAEHFAISPRTIQRWREAGLVRRKGASYHHGDIAAMVQDRHAEGMTAV